MGATSPRPTPEPGSTPETEAPLDLRMQVIRTLRLLASRYRLLALCICIGAVAAFAVAESRGGISPTHSVYRAKAVVRLYDNPLVYHVPPLALHRVEDAGGMPYQIQLAVSDLTLAPAAKKLRTTTQDLLAQVIVSAFSDKLYFETQVRGQERARQTIATVAASFRGVREAIFVYEVKRARAQLVHTAKTAPTPLDRTNARTEVRFADTLLRDRMSITQPQGITVEPLHTPRSSAEATALGAAAGAASWLLVVVVLAVLAPSSIERWRFGRWRQPPTPTRGNAT